MIYGLLTAAAVLITVLLLTAARAVFGDKGRERTITVVPLRGGSGELERLIRALYWENMFRDGSCRSLIAAVSCGIKENDEAAAALAEELEGVELLSGEELLKYISEDIPSDRKNR